MYCMIDILDLKPHLQKNVARSGYAYVGKRHAGESVLVVYDDELIIKKTTVSPKGDVYVHRDFANKIVDIYIYKE